MDFLKRIKIIDKCLIDLHNSKNSDEFYGLCTKLYFNINNMVFNLSQERNKDVFIG